MRNFKFSLLVLFGLITSLFSFSVVRAATVSVTFEASRTNIVIGQEVDLTWTSDGDTCSITGEGEVPTSGSLSVAPIATKTYTLACSKEGFLQGKSSIQVRVIQATFSVSLSIPTVESYIKPGSSATMKWLAFQGPLPYNCSITAPGYTNNFTISSASNNKGTVTVSPNSTTTYKLTCTDSAGSTDTDTQVITVSSSPVVALTASPSSLPDGGGTSYIDWDVGLASRCTATDGDTTWRGLSNMELGGHLPWELTKSTKFSLECFDGNNVSSGKKSVTVAVGVSALCGNGQVDAIVNEECDLGSSSNGSCPAKCSAVCRNNDCSSVVSINLRASPSTIDPGESTKIIWTTSNAVSCEVVKGGQEFNNPIGTSGSATVTPSGQYFQNYDIECYDAGGLSSSDRVTVRIDQNVSLDIVSFQANPAIVPFGYTDPITFTWNTALTGSDETPSCSIGYDDRKGNWKPISPIVVGKSGTITMPQETLRTNSTVGIPGTKLVQLNCYVRINSVGVEDNQEKLYLYFETDPNAAPVVDVDVGAGSDRDDNRTVKPGTTVKVYRAIGGAERCEWTDSRTGTVSLKPFVGERVYSTVINELTTFTLECWNGNLSSKDVSTVTVSSSGGGGDPITPGDNPGLPSLTCSAPNTCETSCATSNRVGLCSTGVYCCSPMAAAQAPQNSSFSFGNVLGFTTVDSLLTKILSYLQGIIVILSLIFIVIGGFLYITSGGNDSQMETGKKSIAAALIGLALGIAAPTFIKEIYSILGASSTNAPAALSLLQIASNILSFLLTIIGIITIIMMVIGGMLYLTAAGNEDQIDKGKKIVKYSLIGITIALAALVLVKQIAKFFVG